MSDEEQAPLRRKRLSNAETVEMLMKAEAQRSAVNNSMMGLLEKFLQQGDERNALLRKHLSKE